jgi:hypothetical protein
MSEVKTKNYINKSIDEMSAEELRHGALKWCLAEQQGEGLGDQQAAKKIKDDKVGSIDKLRRKIAALEAQLKG